VEWKKLGEVAEYVRGVTYSKDDEVNDSDGYKILRANNITLSTHTLNFEDVKIVSRKVKVKENQKLKKDDILICTASGSKEHIGKIAYIFEDIDYYFGGFMGVLRVKEKTLISRFLFHLLTGEKFMKYLGSALSTSTINNLSSTIIYNFPIPIPPLPVQEEIVRILDTFTELAAELDAELEPRKKQYEYYRNKLLTPVQVNGRWLLNGKEVEWKKLGECLQRTKGTSITAQRMAEIHKEGAPIKIFAGGKTVAYVNYGDIPEEDVLTEESVVVKSRGIIGFEYINRPFSHKNEFWSYHSNNPNICIKYVYYYLKNKELFFQSIGRRKTKLPQLSIPDTDNFSIPIPPLSEQERIVAILDKFDALVNDISQGLPAEIEARRKQYEYYRNKLLTFKKIPAGGGGYNYTTPTLTSSEEEKE
jgi:type I restriction enzyme S subunit